MSTRPAPGTRYQALIQLLRTAEDLWNSSRIFFSRWNLSPSQFNVLNLLHGEPAGLSQSELSRLLIMHRSNATGLVDRLEHRRLVRRLDDSSDRRAYRVVLTPAGNDLMAEIYPHYYAAADRVWVDVPEDRIRVLVDELRNLAAQAGAVAVLSSTDLPRPRPRRPSGRGGASSGTPATPVPMAGDSSPESGENSLRTSDL